MNGELPTDAFRFPARASKLSPRLVHRRHGRRLGNFLFTAVVVLIALLWVVELRPQRLGGPADYVMVRGVSMLPKFHSGDLVVVKRKASYSVGDIVAYRVPSEDVGAGLEVIHRIVGGSSSAGFVTQGDNNSAVDDWRPTGSDIVGKAWFVVPHAGTVLAFLHAPLPLASIGAGVAVALVYDPKKKQQERS